MEILLNPSTWSAYADRYVTTADQYGRQIIDYLRQDAPLADQLKGRPFTTLSSALMVDAIYLCFVVIGTIIMKYCTPKEYKLELYALRFVYNLTQMALCAYMFIEAGQLALNNGYTFYCNKWNHKDPIMANILYVFYLSKMLDFVDTFFIITKKSWKQLSFLHVYHHSSIFIVYWSLTNTDVDGDIYWTILLNGFIHFIMYTYYFLSMHTKNVWWKKYLTQLQLLQFTGMVLQSIGIYYTGCRDTPLRVVYMYTTYLIIMLFLFGQFYVRSYVKAPARPTPPSATAKPANSADGKQKKTE